MAIDWPLRRSDHHVLTHIQAGSADQKESRYLLHKVDRTHTCLFSLNRSLRYVPADAGWSAGAKPLRRKLCGLENRHIEAHIPLFGCYIPVCKPLPMKLRRFNTAVTMGPSYAITVLRWPVSMVTTTTLPALVPVKIVASAIGCIKESCCGNRDCKSLSVTIYYREYEEWKLA
jgi:hypothetical protein